MCPPLGGGGSLFSLPQEYTNLWHRWLELWAVGQGLGNTGHTEISINSDTPVGQGPAGVETSVAPVFCTCLVGAGEALPLLQASSHPGFWRSVPLTWTPFPAGFHCPWMQRSPSPRGFPCPSSAPVLCPCVSHSPLRFLSIFLSSASHLFSLLFLPPGCGGILWVLFAAPNTLQRVRPDSATAQQQPHCR